MATMLARCEGAFIGHAIASHYDPSVYMALNVGESLVDCKGFNGPDILSKHLYLYHANRCAIGEVAKDIYQQALAQINTRAPITVEKFRFDQPIIDEFVQLTDKKYGGHTAGCSPAQRSYPLAFCSYIEDDDLIELAMSEAKLTHYSPLAGQVAVIVNSICRSLLKNQSWADAVNSAFTIPNLHNDVKDILTRHHRWATPAVATHPAYAPTVLNAALHYVASAKNAAQAIATAYGTDKHYCPPIAGILAGARWGISEEMLRDNMNDSQLKTVRETANKLVNLWHVKSDDVYA